MSVFSLESWGLLQSRVPTVRNSCRNESSNFICEHLNKSELFWPLPLITRWITLYCWPGGFVKWARKEGSSAHVNTFFSRIRNFRPSLQTFRCLGRVTNPPASVSSFSGCTFWAMKDNKWNLCSALAFCGLGRTQKIYGRPCQIKLAVTVRLFNFFAPF